MSKTNYIRRGIFQLSLALVIVCSTSAAFAEKSKHTTAVHLQGMLSVDDARHLLSRTGIGASPAQILQLRGLSYQSAIDFIIAGISTEPSIPMPGWVEQPLPHFHSRRDMDSELRAQFRNERNAELVQLRQWWIVNMLETRSPQTERLVLFWHDIFATSYQGLGQQSLAMARQNQTFRELGFGSWRRLLKAMISDAALLTYLDAGANHKSSPNENLARELMELFVLGEGNYSEESVREAARALTGLDIRKFHDLKAYVKPWAQDRGQKVLFGKTGEFDADDLIDILLEQEAAAEFLVTKFWYALVSDSPPPAVWVTAQASRFRQSQYDIGTLYRNILESPEFWQPEYRGSIIKSPVDIVVGTARTLEYPKYRWKKMPNWLNTIGMHLFVPPNVSGWTEGAAFITPGYLLNRLQITQQLIADVKQEKSGGGSNMMSESPDMANNMMMDAGRADSLTDNAERDGEHVNDGDNSEVITAATAHIDWGNRTKKNNRRRLHIVLNDVATPLSEFHVVGVRVEIEDNKPPLLFVSTEECWPDCVKTWPRCSWANPHSGSMLQIALPWAATIDSVWSENFDHRCQFDSLSKGEKQLVSTLWANLPDLLSLLRQSRFAERNPKKWSSIMDSIELAYQAAGLNLKQTPYKDYVLELKIGEQFSPPSYQRQAIAPPIPSPGILDSASLITALSENGMDIRRLLLPVFDDQEDVIEVFTTPESVPDNYLKNIVESPVFQLK